MCGILGLNRQLPLDVFATALDTIAHRGPDDQGIRIEDGLSLGHRRLSILDTSSAGHQPMSIDGGDVWIVYNGEIYNHLDLRKQFGPEPYRSHSDTETILRGYLLHGKKIVEMLNGIFALAIFDRRNRELFLARDQLGVKPLYYYQDGRTFAFASEIKALLRLGIDDRRLDPDAFRAYLQFLWSPGERTPFARVRKLLPGHHMTVRLDGPAEARVEKYYELPFDGRYSQASENELIDELDHRLKVAVKRQLLSDVPVGFFLSGGLDSSLIVAIARQETSRPLNCFTIDNGGGKMDGDAEDLGYAIKVAEELELNLHRIPATADLIERLDQVIWHLDEPQADPACALVQQIAQAAREQGTVVLLGGAGGDDLFSGYRRHQMLKMEWLSGPLSGRLGALLKGAVRSVPIPGTIGRRVRKAASGLGMSRLDRMCSWYQWTDPGVSDGLLSREFVGGAPIDWCHFLQDSLRNIPNEVEDLNRLLYWDLKYFLTDHNLNYTDKMGMAAGVEVRVPYLDLELVQFACHLPIAMKMKGWTTKYLLRKVAERYLPHDVIYRPKTGFGAPLRQWMNAGKLDAPIRQMLEAGGTAASVLNMSKVQALVDQTRNRKVDGAYTVFTLLAIHSWLRQFVA